MPPKRGSETLSQASERAVRGLLQKRRKGRVGPGDEGLAAQVCCGAEAAVPEAEREEAELGLKGDDPCALANEADGEVWEEVSTPAAPMPEQSESSPPDAETGISIELAPEAVRRRHVFSKADHALALLLHRSHLVCLLARARWASALADLSCVRACALSMVPLPLVVERPAGGPRSPAGRKWVEAMLCWFDGEFALEEPRLSATEAFVRASQLAACASAGSSSTLLDGVLGTLAARAGTAETLAVVWVAALRALGCEARLVRVLEPLSWRPGRALREGGGAAFPLRSALGASPEDDEAPPRQRAGRGAASNGAAWVGGDLTKEAGEQVVAAALTKAEPLPKHSGRAKSRSANSSAPCGNKTSKASSKKKDSPDLASARRSDLELEQQLAMALQATAAAAGFSHPAAAPSSASRPERRARLASLGLAARPQLSQTASYSRRRLGVGRHWAEVLLEGAPARWTHVDPLTKWLDRPGEVEGLQLRSQVLSAVLAVGAGGGVRDVTPRYARARPGSRRDVPGGPEGEGWWRQVLAGVRSGALDRSEEQAARASGIAAASLLPHAFPAPSKAAAQAEEAELRARSNRAAQTAPTTVQGFRDSPTFVLLKHLSVRSALRPGSSERGRHRGEAYALRADVSELHTTSGWRRRGREVLAAAATAPAKLLPRRGFDVEAALGVRRLLDEGRGCEAEEEVEGKEVGKKEVDGEDERDATPDAPVSSSNPSYAPPLGMSAYYGDWQTAKLVIPPASGGKVPRTQHGSVEIPPLVPSLPPGTVHLDFSDAWAAAKRLGVDAAPALVGFERRGGRSAPTFRGVVVCAEHARAVRAAALELEACRERQAEEARLRRAEADWRRLLKAVVTRVKLQGRYEEEKGGEEEEDTGKDEDDGEESDEEGEVEPPQMLWGSDAEDI